MRLDFAICIEPQRHRQRRETACEKKFELRHLISEVKPFLPDFSSVLSARLWFNCVLSDNLPQIHGRDARATPDKRSKNQQTLVSA
jgi:hypothetical protein